MVRGELCRQGRTRLFRSLGREAEGILRGSSGRKNVPRLFTMRSQGGGAFAVSMKPLKNATCSAGSCHFW